MTHPFIRCTAGTVATFLFVPYLFTVKATEGEIHYGKLPAVFVENHGQTHASVRYLSRGTRAPIFFTDRDVRFVLERDGIRTALSLELLGAQTTRVEGREPTRTVINHLRSTGALSLPTYREVTYRDAWPGIDALFRDDGGRLTYEFILQPGAHVEDVRLRFAGAEAVTLTSAGNLSIRTASGEVLDTAPYTFQPAGDERHLVASRFVILGDNTVGFAVSDYDRTRPLVIDPSIVYATYVGGSHWDNGNAVAVDALGAAYIVGQTYSADFPITPGVVDVTHGGEYEAFVAKISPAGDALEYVTYLGGSAGDSALGVAVDVSGNAWVTGATLSPDFPTTAAALSRTRNSPAADPDGFVAKLNARGSSLLYSTYLGANAHTVATSVAVDAAGNAHVVGVTRATNLPTTAGAVARAPVNTDAFLLKFNSTGASITYGSYFGGSSSEGADDVDVDAAGMTYVLGTTNSSDLPASSGAYRRTLHGPTDVFVAKFNTAASSSLAYSTYVGSGGFDDAQGLAVNADTGEAHVVMNVDFRQRQFPPGGTSGPAVVKFNPSGTAIDYARGLGPRYTARTAAVDIGLDAAGTPYVGGIASEGGYVWVSRLDERGIEASRFKLHELGGDRLGGLDVDGEGGVYLTGTAGPRFPVTDNAPQRTHGGNDEDAYVAKIEFAGVSTTNVAEAKPARASSLEASHLAAANAFDGDLSTRWSSQFSDPQWLMVDLGQRFRVDRVVMHWEAAFASHYELHISDDGTTWYPLRSTIRDDRFAPLADGQVDSHTNLNGTGRYVRMYGLARGTQWGYSLYEMEVFGTPVSTPAPPATPVNLASQARHGYSSIESLQHLGQNAFDGNLRTRWSSEFRDPQNIWVDLGARVDIARIVLRWETAFARDYTIQVSNDGANWQVVRTVTNGDGGVDDFTGVNVRARYVMMHGTRRATQWGYSLWEFEVYGWIRDSNTPPPSSPQDIVLHAADVDFLTGMAVVADSTAAGGQKIASTDLGRAWLDEADLSGPRAVFEFSVAQAGTYRLWLRLRAHANTKWNDSVWVQFSDATRNAQPVYQPGGDALLVNLENCSACGVQEWGWQDNSWWLNQSSIVHLPAGRQWIYILLREDGVEFDQIVLSPEQFLNNAPGAVKNDSTIVPKP